MKIKDHGYKNHIKHLGQLRKIKSVLGAVGMHSADEGQKPISNAAIMRILELGYPPKNLPPRNAIYKALSENTEYLQNLTVQLIKENYSQEKGFDIQKIAEGIGTAMAGLVKAAILSGVDPQNADSTLRQKKGTLPYIDKRELINTIQGGSKK